MIFCNHQTPHDSRFKYNKARLLRRVEGAQFTNSLNGILWANILEIFAAIIS